MAQGLPKELLLIHLQTGDDISKSIIEACKAQGVKDGYILGATGTLGTAAVFTAAPIGVKNGELHFGYMDEALKFGGLLGAQTLNSVEGVVCHQEDGELSLHMHYSFTDPDGFATGGHLPDGSIALNAVTIMVGVIDKVDMLRKWDDSVNIFVFAPTAREEN